MGKMKRVRINAMGSIRIPKSLQTDLDYGFENGEEVIIEIMSPDELRIRKMFTKR